MSDQLQTGVWWYKAEIERLTALIVSMQEQRESDGRELVRLQAKLKRLEEIIYINVDPTGMDADDHELVMQCGAATEQDNK